MFRQLTVLPAGTVVGHIRVPWSRVVVPVVTARSLAGLAPSGASLTLQVHMHAPASSFQDGQPVGSITVNGLVTPSSTTLVSGGASGSPTLAWRIFHP